MPGEPLLSVDDLHVAYPARGRGNSVQAVHGVSFDLDRGETLGLIGESGSGKTSIARALMQLVPASKGSISVDGADLQELRGDRKRNARSRIQMVFQDPTASLDPRMCAWDSVEEPLRVQRLGGKRDRAARVSEMLELVAITRSQAYRFPHELSGGQKQRIGIARALILAPDIVICDEAVSALDVALQAEILQLLQELQERLNLAYLFITHDLSVVAHVADRLAVMYLGQLVEDGPIGPLLERPLHPYTEALISAQPRIVPSTSVQRIVLDGDIPSPINPPSGCRFHTRCRYAEEQCRIDPPELRLRTQEHHAACHFAKDLTLQGVGG